MLREYVVSEAMHALGIPTTHSLAVVATGRTVQRDTAAGAVLTRIAESHLRVGSFQYWRPGRAGVVAALGRSRDRPPCIPARARDAERPYLALLEAVIAARRQSWWRSGCSSGSSTA